MEIKNSDRGIFMFLAGAGSAVSVCGIVINQYPLFFCLYLTVMVIFAAVDYRRMKD